MFDEKMIVDIINKTIGCEISNYNDNPFDYGLDSLGVLKLVTYIEDKFEIEIDDDDLTIENMSSVNLIIKMVKKYENRRK